MPRRSLLLVAIVVGLVATGSPAATALPSAGAPAGTGGLPVALERLPLTGAFPTSSNVQYVGTIPLDSPGVGGDVVVVDGQRRFYVTGLKGLSIYDVTNPALPTLLGFFPFHHAQNEDVEVSEDGSRVVIGADGSILVPVAPQNVGIHVLDTSNPSNIRLLASNRDSTHTAECATADCTWIYASNGRIYDATRAAEGVLERAGNWNVMPDPANPGAVMTVPGGRHALERDATGLVISDSATRLVLDPTGRYGQGVGTPAVPEVIATGKPQPGDGGLQHNNVRPAAEQWVPRAAGDGDPTMRPGELLIGNSESNLRPTCSASSGGLTSWSMVNFDRGAELRQLSAFRPVNGTYADGNPAVNALGCSGHWFTWQNGIVAASWYEHGVRIIDVDEATGEFRELGWFQPGAAEAGAAHWIDDEYVYSVDYARGIDIIRFDRDAPLPSEDDRVASWLQPVTEGPIAAAERRGYGGAVQD